jgi:hypothetical protein
MILESMGIVFCSKSVRLNNKCIANPYLETTQTLARISIGSSITVWTLIKPTHSVSTLAHGPDSAVTSL